MPARAPKPRMAGVRLRSLLLFAFALCALVPAAMLALWVFHSQMESERDNTRAKQIALARTFALALEHFADDRLALFSEVAAAYFSHDADSLRLSARQESKFAYFAVIDRNGRSKVFPLDRDLNQRDHLNFLEPIYGISTARTALADADMGIPAILGGGRGLFFRGGNETLPPRLAGALLAEAGLRPTVTAAMLDHRGQPAVFLVQRGQNGAVFAAALAMEPLVAMQRGVSFGIHGHAVIVDGRGQTLAHPRQDWIDSLQPLTGVAPVQRAIAGETGAMQFFATGPGKEAIAGYTQTGTAGWGVLMVRPLAEIDSAAWQNARIAIAVIAGGAVAALVVAWFMTGVIVRPIERAAATARDLGNGRLTARVEPLTGMPAELRELGATLNQMAERIDSWRRTANETLSTVRAADQAKRDFMATLSHEIRTPLNAIIGFGELVIMTSGPGEQDAKHRDYANSIVTAGRHLLDLIDGILDLAAIEAGHLEVETTAVDLRKVLEDCAALLAHSIASHRVALAIDLPDGLPRVAADPAKLRQVVLNLAGNALKFTPAGGEVRLSAAASGNSVALRIADNGVGMTPDEIRTALAPFGRVRNPQVQTEKGTGLGLPLARRLVQTMQGGFSLESEPDKGTTITINLPAAAA